MFDRIRHADDKPTELDAVLALAYVCQQSLASLNARGWANDPSRKALRQREDQQIAANHKTTLDALWYRMSDVWALEQMARRRDTQRETSLG